MINDLGAVAWDMAEAAGWHDRETGEQDRINTNLVLIHSEVSEAVEAWRKHGHHYWHGDDGKPEGMASELADVIIRVTELAHMLHIDLEDAIADKLEYNERRLDVPARSGGKAF